MNSLNEIMQNIKNVNPLVHCLTNYVTVNDVANSLLSIGASPIMADSIDEVEEIVGISKAVYINIGTLNSTVLKSMEVAQNLAVSKNIPVILDAVGAGASSLRNKSTISILERSVDIVHGNYSEIAYIASSVSNTKGVDASSLDESLDIISMAKKVAKKYNCICVATGEKDIITDSETTYAVKNGCREMGNITGTGCMLTGLIAASAAVEEDFLLASTYATALMAISGERAFENYRGLGSFHVNIFNELSTIDEHIFEGAIKIEKL